MCFCTALRYLPRIVRLFLTQARSRYRGADRNEYLCVYLYTLVFVNNLVPRQSDNSENGNAKVSHGSGVIISLRAT